MNLEKLHSDKIDSLEKLCFTLPQPDCPLKHGFANGFYIRTIQMPKGSLVISRIHKTTHPFWVTKGHCAVWDEFHGVQQIKAGHVGVTTPGTRRLLYMHEDTEWTTFHAGNWTPDTDPELIVAEVTEPHDCSQAADLTPEMLSELKLLPKEETA